MPYAFKLIIDKGFVQGGGSTRDIARWFEYLLMLVGVMALATAFRFYFVSWLGERTVADIRLAVHRNLLRLSPGFFEENRPAEITSRLTVDTTIIEQVVGTTVSVALRNIVLSIACIVILVWLSPKLAGMILLGLPFVLGPIVLLGRQVRIISTRSQDRIADVGAVTSEVLGAMKIVQAFGQQGREAGRFAEAVERVFATAKKRILIRAIMTAIAIFLMFGAITMIIWQGAIDVAAGRISGGTIAAFVLYGGLLAGAFGALSEVYGDFLRAAGASERLAELLEAEPDIRPPAKPKPLPEPARGEAVVRERHLSLSDAAGRLGAREFQPDGEAARAAGAGRAVGCGQDDHLPARRALLRPAIGARRCSTASTCAKPIRRTFASALRSSRRRPSCSPRARATIFATAIGTRPRMRSGRPRATPMPRNSSVRSRRDSTRSWAKAELACQVDSASAFRSRGRFCAMLRCSCSTKRRLRWTRKASGWCRMRSTG